MYFYTNKQPQALKGSNSIDWVWCVNGFPLSYDILWWLEMDEIWLFKGIDRDLSRREINSLDIIITRVKYFNCSISCNLVPGIYKKKWF